MKAKSEVPKERTSEGDTHMRNENGTGRYVPGQESSRNPTDAATA